MERHAVKSWVECRSCPVLWLAIRHQSGQAGGQFGHSESMRNVVAVAVELVMERTGDPLPYLAW